MFRKTSPAHPHPRKRDKDPLLFLGVFLLFFLPLGVTLLLTIPSAILDYVGQSYQNTPLLMLSQVLAVLSDILQPSLLCAAYTVLGYALFRRQQGLVLLLGAILSPLVLSLLRFLLNYLLCLVGVSTLMPSAFLAQLDLYLLSVLVEYATELLLLAVTYTIFLRGTKKQEKTREGLSGNTPLFQRNTVFYRCCRTAFLLRLLAVLLARVINAVSDFSSVISAVEGYGFLSGQTLLALLSVILLPLFYFSLTAFALRQSFHIAGETLDARFFADEKKVRSNAV